jgi:predicted porin
MNKKLIPFAVAALVAAPMAAQADVTIYGKAIVSYDAVKIDGQDRQYKVVANSPIAGAPRSSRFGLKGSEDLGGGLKAIWKMEFSYDMAGDAWSNSAVGASRNAYVGLTSGWGTALMGRHDTPYKMSVGSYDLFADQLGDFNGTVGFEDLRATNAIAYVSPDFGGFNIAGAAVAPGGDDLAEAYSIAGNYKNGGIKVSLAYEDLGDVTRAQDFEKKWGIAGSFKSGAWGIMGRYDDASDLGANSGVDAQMWQIGGSFGFGNNVIKAMWGQNDTDNVSKVDTWALGWDHNFTKRTQAWIQYADVDKTWDGVSLGMTHKF